ncbi:MAG: efflux RND transporter permease subunit [Nitrospirae bacterium]|nr:efflux RND transporter permease subunit [Nitrospirota bacterium]
MKEGFAGLLAKAFVHSKLTPVIAIISLVLGFGAVWLTPKEEEPQISLPMIDIQTGAPGFEAAEVERQVTEPIERAVWGLDGVEYVYSSSRAHSSLVTVRFKVGEPMEPSLVKVHHKLLSMRNDLPSSALPSQVKSYSIDDVSFLTLTFSSPTRDDYSLRTLVAPLARELSSTPDLSRVEMLGGQKRSVRVIVDPGQLSARGVSLTAVADALTTNDAFGPAGKTWGRKMVYDVEIGKRPAKASDIEEIAIGQRGGRVIHIKDVASVVDGPEEETKASLLIDKKHGSAPQKAVSIVFAKRKGTNVVVLANQLLERAKLFSKTLPPDISMTTVRNFGATAADKSKELIEHLLLATLSVTVLIAIMMGIRASLVVAIAIPVTLSLTLAIYYFMGYTLNRVTLFALIFSIGILVDDAIVVVENIERHLKSGANDGMTRTIIRAVSEVGNPTILATFTVIAAILPMAFVRGLMGPYMKPIPVGASLAMILSLLVAFIITPWAAVKLLRKAHAPKEDAPPSNSGKEGFLDRFYRSVTERILSQRRYAAGFALLIAVLFLAAGSLLYFKAVKVKMLPFDNKNEFQILIDYPPTTPLAQTAVWSTELAQTLIQNPEVKRVQIYTGEPAPFSFSGMVKHTYLRHQDFLNDFQILLTDKNERKDSSHEIIESLRPRISAFGKSKNAVIKVLEIPPGPPVLATLVAEIYGPTEAIRREVAQNVYQVFQEEPSVVDLDFSWRPGRPRQIYFYDQARGGLFGTRSEQPLELGKYIFSETPLLYLDDFSSPEEVSIDLSIDPAIRSGSHPFQGETIRSFESGVVPMSQVIRPPVLRDQETLFRKNLKPVSYVMSELSGKEEAPVYGVLKLSPKIHYPTQTADVPWDTASPVVKWDGEWFITYEVFRDLGMAFAFVMVLIYVLVVGWFKSFSVPLVIMAPIPISLIGILPGHALIGAFFTATSMIGFIAGAGIIVRNSIILVDFIEQQIQSGAPLKEAVVSAGILRFRPMLMTAAAVVVGSSVILFDPIFQGLAISLIFGEIAATLLSRLAVPVLYYWFIGKSRVRFILNNQQEGRNHVH